MSLRDETEELERRIAALESRVATRFWAEWCIRLLQVLLSPWVCALVAALIAGPQFFSGIARWMSFMEPDAFFATILDWPVIVLVGAMLIGRRAIREFILGIEKVFGVERRVNRGAGHGREPPEPPSIPPQPQPPPNDL